MARLSKLSLHLQMVAVTMLMFVAMLGVNHLLFKAAEFVPGVNWVYLPAGVRLLATLLFGGAGAVGLLLVSWGVNFLVFFPDDFARAFMGGVVATVAPYGVYLLAKHWFGLQASLSNLSSRKLIWLILIYALASPLLHHLWFFVSGRVEASWTSMLVMAVGDFNGALVVFYSLKLMLNKWKPLMPQQQR